MATITWPVTLPQQLLVDGYARSAKDLLLVSPMEIGPPKVRRRTSNNIEQFQGSVIVTTTQLGYFKTFFYTTALGGSLRFNFTDPDDGVTSVEMMIRSFKYAPYNNGPKWRIDVDLVIMP